MELFAGIKGARQALGGLPVEIAGVLSAEADEALRSLAAARYPEDSDWGEVQNVNREAVREAVHKSGRIDMAVLVAGFPCKDTSRLKAGRQNLDGKHGRLFFHIPRVRSLLVQETQCPVRILVENPMMDVEAAKEISAELGCIPLRINAKAVSAAARDRLYWVDSEFIREERETVKVQDWHVQVDLA